MDEYKGKLKTLKEWKAKGKITLKQYIDAKFKLEERYNKVTVDKVKEVFDGEDNTS